MKKSICILGSTGSIGKSSMSLISENKNVFSKVIPLSIRENSNDWLVAI